MEYDELKAKLLELLEVNSEFRYAVAGKLGLLELLRRLDSIEAELAKLLKNHERLWFEVKSLREDQGKLWLEIKSLRESQEKLLEEVRLLHEDQRRLRASFEALGRALGATFEQYTAGFVKLMLEEMGYPEAIVEKRILMYNGKLYEMNVFCEEPLVVGEVTPYLGDIDEARRELRKLYERFEVAERVLGKKVLLKILALANAPREVIEYLKKEVKEKGIKLIYGKELEILV